MQYDVILILAGGIQEDGSLPQSVQSRIHAAKKLYDQKLAPHILMSGRWSHYWKDQTPPSTEAHAMSLFAQKLGIPSRVIFKEEHSRDTQGNAYHTQELFLRPRNWKKIIVVTSNFHIPRTEHIFRQILDSDVQLQFVPAQTHYTISQRLFRYLKEWLRLQKYRLSTFTSST